MYLEMEKTLKSIFWVLLGSIVTYKNDQKLLEIIDGQQRITTLTLLFRAFYEHFMSILKMRAKMLSKVI